MIIREAERSMDFYWNRDKQWPFAGARLALILKPWAASRHPTPSIRAEAGEGLPPASLFSENGLAHFNALQRAGVKRQNKEPHMPWPANTFWQLLLSRVLFCCKHC